MLQNFLIFFSRGWITFLCMCVQHILSFINGYLDYLNIFTIVNNDEVNIECSFVFKLQAAYLFPSNIHPEMWFWDDMVVLFLVSWGSSILKAATSFYILLGRVQGFPFLLVLLNTVIFYLFLKSSLPNRCEEIAYCGLICISLDY
jgi:hypothetical protein